MFEIHLINVPCIDVNSLISEHIGTRRKEEEMIFLGGGKFYSNRELTEEGFVEVASKFSKTKFECWYALEDLKKGSKTTHAYASPNACAISPKSPKSPRVSPTRLFKYYHDLKEDNAALADLEEDITPSEFIEYVKIATNSMIILSPNKAKEIIKLNRMNGGRNKTRKTKTRKRIRHGNSKKCKNLK